MKSRNDIFFPLELNYVKESPLGIKTPIGYEKPDKFPNCCDFHRGIARRTDAFLKKDLVKLPGFDEFARFHNITANHYSYLEEKIVEHVSFTEHKINTSIEQNDWLKDISDYVEANIYCFGQPNIGVHIYVESLIHYMKYTTANIPDHKRQKIISVLEKHLNIPEKVEYIDLNRLNQIYQRWVSSFPFELNFFVPLKEHFSKRKPFLAEKPIVNRYTGLAKAKLHTEASLVLALVDLTKQLLKAINTKELVKSGQLKNIDEVQYEMILQEHEANQKGLLNEYNNTEMKYLTTIKKWLENERKFFNNLKSVDKKLLPNTKKKASNSTVKSFRLKYGKSEKVKIILTKLNNEIYLLDEEKSSIDDLMTVLESKDLSKENPIYLGCYNNQFAYIIKGLKKYIEKLSPANVDKSRLFISKEGTVLSKDNLYNSLKKNPHPDRQDFIDSVFSDFQ